MTREDTLALWRVQSAENDRARPPIASSQLGERKAAAGHARLDPVTPPRQGPPRLNTPKQQAADPIDRLEETRASCSHFPPSAR